MADVLVPRRRDYGAEGRRLALPSEIVRDHPLRTVVKELDTKGGDGGAEGPLGPLSGAPDPLISPEVDPLRQIGDSAEMVKDEKSTEEGSAPDMQGFMPWKSRKPGILVKYTTTDMEPVKCNFIDGDDLPQEPSAPVDRTQQRLAQLDDQLMKQEETKMMTQKQYVAHIETQRRELCAAWAANERRRSLILVIQSSKLLGGATISQFYPSKFVLITDVLDTFGDFVFNRLRKVGFMDNKQAMDKFGPGLDDFESANSVARNLARNWFFKISSIRELLPRLYVETAFLPSYQFFKGHESMEDRLMRLARMIRGVGNPLIATYVRAYLARKALEVHPKSNLYLLQIVFDFFFTFKDIKRRQADSSKLKMTWDSYMDLYSPALDWLFQCLGHNAAKDTFLKILQKYEEGCNTPIVLNHLMQNFTPSLISGEAVRIANLIRDSDSASSFPKYQMWATLCTNLILSPPSQVLPPLNAIWRCVTKIENAEHFITVAEIMVEYPLRYCGPLELSIFFSDVLRHILQERAYETLQGQIQSLVLKVISHYSTHGGMKTVVEMEPFQKLMDSFVGQTRLDVFKDVVAAYVADKETTTDAVVVHWIFTLCKTLHDSVNALSHEDYVREISRIISSFLCCVDYGRDVETELNFLVLCRQSFTNLDEVNRTLVLRVVGLAMRTYRLVGGHHTNKTSNFVAACLAYCYITIPSIDAMFPRLQLTLLCAQVALSNNLLSQTDHFLKAIIELIPSVPLTMKIDGEEKPTEPIFMDFLNSVFSTLLIVPGHPDHGGLYLLMGLMNALNEFEWKEGSDALARIWTAVVALVYAIVQDKFLYSVPGVESNEVLYAGDDEYAQQCRDVLSKVSESFLSELAKLGTLVPDLQVERALDFFHILVRCGDIAPRSFTANLAFNLFNLTRKQQPDCAYRARILKALQEEFENADDPSSPEMRNLEGLLGRLIV